MTLKFNSTTVNEVYLNHNVGYTIVGSPTIVNGVVSGFSNNDYLICNQTKPECSSFEKQIKFTTGTIGTFQAILGTMQNERYDGLFIRSDGQLNCTLSKAGGGSQDNTINYVLSENTTYIVYLQLSSNQLLTIIKNADGQQLHSQTFTFIVNNQELANVSFGRRFTTNTNSFTGSIDLNSTYIKVNGITWFKGKETASSTVNTVRYNGTTVWTRPAE